MDETKQEKGLTRRGFMKTVGLGGMAATALSVPQAIAAQQQGGDKAPSVPRRKLGKTGRGVDPVPGRMFDTINNQLLLRQAHNWGVNYWDTAEVYGNGLSEDGFGRFFNRNPEARKDIFLVTKLRPAAPEKNPTDGMDKCLKAEHGLCRPVFILLSALPG